MQKGPTLADSPASFGIRPAAEFCIRLVLAHKSIESKLKLPSYKAFLTRKRRCFPVWAQKMQGEAKARDANQCPLGSLTLRALTLKYEVRDTAVAALDMRRT